jgi:hypothetical protein
MKMKKLKAYLKQMKKGIFYEAFDLVKKKPKLYFLILLMDVVFLSVSFLLSQLGNMAVTPFVSSENLVFLNAFLPGYLLLIILLYSFTKYTAIHFVSNMLKKVKINFKKIGWFYLLNIIIITFAFVTLMLLIAILKGGVKEQYLTWGSRIGVAIWFFFVYALVSVAQSLFVLGSSFKDSLKNCFVITFSKINKYYGVYVISLGIVFAYLLIYYALGYTIGNLLTLNAMRYNISFLILSTVLIYGLAAYNRIYFYLITKSITKK